jgi:hypothetical protein
MAFNRAAALTFTFRRSQRGYPCLICSCFLSETFVRGPASSGLACNHARYHIVSARKGEFRAGIRISRQQAYLGKAGIVDDESCVAHRPSRWIQRLVRTVRKGGLLSLQVQRETRPSSRFVSEQFANPLIPACRNRVPGRQELGYLSFVNKSKGSLTRHCLCDHATHDASAPRRD